MKIFVKATGCKLNQQIAENIAIDFTDKHNEIVNNVHNADTILIAGCIVTKRAQGKFRRLLNTYKKKYPNKKIVLSGCIPEYMKTEYEYLKQDSTFNKTHIYTKKTRQMIIIQTGCNKFCSYCIVPYKRGREVSRNINDILFEIEYANKNNIKEIVLTGVHIGRYNYNNNDLAMLLSKILNVFNGRVRLSSLDINELNPQLLNLIINNKKIVPMLHLSIQHTENRILKLMKRDYIKKDIDNVLNKISKYRDIRLGADIIVGFPSETDNEFNSMYKYLRNSFISHFHIFRYSIREKTLSAFMINHVSETIKKQRRDKLQALANKKNIIYNKQSVNKLKYTIIEKIKFPYSYGKTEDYLNVKIIGMYNKGDILKTKILDYDNNYLIGQVIND